MHPSGLAGFSTRSAANASLDLARTFGTTRSGVTTAGAVHLAGGEVTSTSGLECTLMSRDSTQRCSGVLLTVHTEPGTSRAEGLAEMSRVYADFNNCDAQGRIRLNAAGSIDDMKSQDIRLSDGMVLTIYCDDLEATGIVRELAGGGGGWNSTGERS
jgi:hypothetical protein